MTAVRTLTAAAVLLATTAVALFWGTSTGWGFVADTPADRLWRSAPLLAAGVLVQAAGILTCRALLRKPLLTWWLLLSLVPVTLAAAGSL